MSTVPEASGSSETGTPHSCTLVGLTDRMSDRGKALYGRYLVPLVPLVPRLEHQLPVPVPALVQTLHLLQVDPPVQSVLQAPLRRLVFPLAPAAMAVPVTVTVPGHRGAKDAVVVSRELGSVDLEVPAARDVSKNWTSSKFEVRSVKRTNVCWDGREVRHWFRFEVFKIKQKCIYKGRFLEQWIKLTSFSAKSYKCHSFVWRKRTFTINLSKTSLTKKMILLKYKL